MRPARSSSRQVGNAAGSIDPERIVVVVAVRVNGDRRHHLNVAIGRFIAEFR